MKKINSIALASLMVISSSFVLAQKPKYSADVPEFLLTPDKVETELLGDLELVK